MTKHMEHKLDRTHHHKYHSSTVRLGKTRCMQCIQCPVVRFGHEHKAATGIGLRDMLSKVGRSDWLSASNCRKDTGHQSMSWCISGTLEERYRAKFGHLDYEHHQPHIYPGIHNWRHQSTASRESHMILTQLVFEYYPSLGSRR